MKSVIKILLISLIFGYFLCFFAGTLTKCFSVESLFFLPVILNYLKRICRALKIIISLGSKYDC